MGVTNHLLTGMILQVVPHHPTGSGVQKKAKIAGMKGGMSLSPIDMKYFSG